MGYCDTHKEHYVSADGCNKCIPPMKPRDKINLINRAIAALETPDDLSRSEIGDLIEELDMFADEYRRKEK